MKRDGEEQRQMRSESKKRSRRRRGDYDEEDGKLGEEGREKEWDKGSRCVLPSV